MVALHDRPQASSSLRVSRLLPMLLAASALVMIAGPGFAEEPAEEGTAPQASERLDPHGQPDGCPSCHLPGQYSEPVGAPLPSGEICVPCHETSDMHPSNVPVEQAQVPPDWPLEEDRLVCATCHAEPSCVEGRGTRAPYLRESPYEHGIEFCWRCHPAADYSRTDPHHPAKRRDPTDASCAFCHHGVPADGATAAKARLRAEPKALCELCHAGAVHSGTATHLGVVMEGEQRAALSPALGVDAGGEIRCWTCHEVHGDRTLAAPTEVADPTRGTQTPYTFSEMPGPERLWSEEPPPWLLRPPDPAHPVLLPLEGGAICRACHGSGP